MQASFGSLGMDESTRRALQEVRDALSGTEKQLEHALFTAPMMVRLTEGGGPKTNYGAGELVLRAFDEMKRNPQGRIEHLRDVSMELFGVPSPSDGTLHSQIRHLVDLALAGKGKAKNSSVKNPPLYGDKSIQRSEICAHCGVSANITMYFQSMLSDVEGVWRTCSGNCPSCKRIIIYLRREVEGAVTGTKELLIWPQARFRKELPADVPKEFSADYEEALAVLPYSPKASAALSRRCLQNFIQNHIRIYTGELSSEVQKLLDRNEMPPYLAETIDNIRIIGNFAAHPLKSTRTLEIQDVEEGEAEYSLDALRELLSFYFVELPQREAKAKLIQDKYGTVLRKQK